MNVRSYTFSNSMSIRVSHSLLNHGSTPQGCKVTTTDLPQIVLVQVRNRVGLFHAKNSDNLLQALSCLHLVSACVGECLHVRARGLRVTQSTAAAAAAAAAARATATTTTAAEDIATQMEVG